MLSLEQTLPLQQCLPREALSPDLRELSVNGLSYESGGKTLLSCIDLDLPAIGISVIMGANGAGKSLFLRLIHGLIEPKSGSIRWGGTPLDAAVRKRQAMVFQKPVLLRRSVAANLDFVLSGQQSSRDNWLDRIGLAAQAKQPARKLSGGEQQRLAMARALATTPKILLLDEPTASLDPISATIIEDMMSDAAAAGTKVILVTHNIHQARRIADDIAFFDSGRLVERSTAASFFENPQSVQARTYLSGEIQQ